MEEMYATHLRSFVPSLRAIFLVVEDSLKIPESFRSLLTVTKAAW